MWGRRAGCSIWGTARSICEQAWLGGWEKPSSAREEGQDQKGPLGEQRGGTKILSTGEPASSVSRHSWGGEMRHQPLSPRPTRTRKQEGRTQRQGVLST